MQVIRALVGRVGVRLWRAVFRFVWRPLFTLLELDSVVTDVRVALRQPWAQGLIRSVTLVDEAVVVRYDHPPGAPRDLLSRWSFADVHLVECAHVHVYPHAGLVVDPRHGLMLVESVNGMQGFFGAKNATNRLVFSRPTRHVQRGVAAASVHNWFHFACEDLPGLLDARRTFGVDTVVTPTGGLPSIAACIDALGFQRLELGDRLISADTFLFRTREIWPEFVRPSVATSVRTAVLEALDARDGAIGAGGASAAGRATGPDAVFISRRGSARRAVAGQEALEDALQGRGVQIVSFEDLTFEEHVATMRRSKLVIGLHGAGLTHMLWAAPECRVIEIVPVPRDASNHCYVSLAQGLGFGYEQVACVDDPVNPFGAVPVDKVLARL